VQILTEPEIRSVMSIEHAIDAVTASFTALAHGQAQLPSVMHFDFPEAPGDAHAKGAHIHGSPVFVLKVASGFYNNAAMGLPVSAGLMIAFDANSGQPVALLFDNGYLTNLRTGAAGAVAATHLSESSHTRLGLIGAGTQARFQLEALRTVRTFSAFRVWDRFTQTAQRFATNMAESHGLEVEIVESVEELVGESDLLVTVTPSQEPIVAADWVRPGTLVIAVGADAPDKQELDPVLVRRANGVFADRIDQCVEAGEIHHALQSDFAIENITGELGDVIVGKVTGRRSSEDIIVCDLTGVGTHDAAVAELTISRARDEKLGSELPVPI
jgi:alanine dehydrogenase